MESLIIRWPFISRQNRRRRDIATRHNGSDRRGSFSNNRPQSFMVSDASHLDVKTQSLSMLHWQTLVNANSYQTIVNVAYHACISMHGMVNMFTLLWHLDHSAGRRKYIRFWYQDHSAVWRKDIRLWDLDHSVGWRTAARGIPNEMSAKNHRPRVAWLARNEEVRTRTRLVSLNETIQKQRVSLFFR